MKKFIPLLLSTVLVIGAAGCQNTAKTSANAPDNTNEAPKSPDTQTAQTNQNDAQNQTRKAQLNSDIRAHEQRNNATGGGTNRNGNALASEVRDKLEANIPDSQLSVQANNGIVTVAGTVANQQDLNKIVPEASKIKGVKNVVNKALVAPPKAKS
ncbi:MAG: BON domain-containing protein [Chroococcidiopsidaceae cyanobacterium CP_BM_ER_R8_30]|nr:BON domain-containing protein [Chroococcidiopsidaceae cyanobacterium CP_BM_ER_R8_30]